MRHYETIFIARPNLPEDEITALIERNAGIIEAEGGTVHQVDQWGLKKLAYPIKKNPQGYYVLTDYTATPAAVQEMERLFRIDERVLKFLTVRLDQPYTPPAEEEPATDETEEETAAEA